MYIDLTYICRIPTVSILFSCLCELCHSHRLMVEGLRTATRTSEAFGENADKGLKERVAKVRKQLEDGTLEFDQSKEHGKSRIPQAVVREKDWTKLDKKWSEGVEGNKSERVFDLSNPNSLAKDWFPADQSIPVPSDKVFCSFCQNEIKHTNPTYGRGPIRFIEKFETLSVDPRVVQTSLIVTSDKLVACPNCCLKIKPKVEEHCQTCLLKRGKCQCREYKPVRRAIHSNVRVYDEG